LAKREHGGREAGPKVTGEEEASHVRDFKGGRAGKEKSARRRRRALKRCDREEMEEGRVQKGGSGHAACGRMVAAAHGHRVRAAARGRQRWAARRRSRGKERERKEKAGEAGWWASPQGGAQLAVGV
jgi:hypothetical protein